MSNGSIGVLRGNKTEASARNDIKKWLNKLRGIDIASINTSLSVGTNSAILNFKYQNKDYEFRSDKQKNARLNLCAIARVIENKVRHSIMQVEDFGTSMIGYLRLPSPEGTNYSNNTNSVNSEVNDKLTVEECGLFEVEPYASNEQLRKAYLTKLKFFHPDRFREQPEMLAQAEEKTGKINQVYDDVMKRRGRMN